MFSKSYFKNYKEHLSIAVPVAISQLGHILVGVADTIMAGRLGSVPLASATIATSIFIPFLMFGIGISYGATSLIAKADGAKDTEEIRRLFSHSIWLNLVLSIFLFLILYYFSFVLRLLHQPQEVVEAAVPFAELLAWSILPLMVFQTFKQFAEGLSFTRNAMIISILSNVLNVLLIFVFTDGWFGLTPMGLNGIAIATLIARILMAIAMISLIYNTKAFQLYRKGIFAMPIQFSKIKELVWISLPIGFQMVLESGAFGLAAIMTGWLGAGEIAAHQIALNMAAVTYMTASGFAASATVRVGNAVGRRNIKEVKEAGYSALVLVIGFMTITALLFISLRFYLPTLFIKEVRVIEMASSLLLIAAFFQLSDGIQVVGFGALRGMGDVIVPTISVVVAYYIIGLPIGYWLAFPLGLGISGVWYGLSLGLLLLSLFLLYRFKKKQI